MSDLIPESKPETLHDPRTFGARHDAAWQKSFITPIAREMKKRGVAYLLITIRDDGKAVFVIEPNETSPFTGANEKANEHLPS